MAKRQTSITIEGKYYDWATNEFGNFSQYVEDIVKREYEEHDDPLPKLKQINKEAKKLSEREDFYYDKLLKVLEDGNKKEREEAEVLMKDKEERENKELNKNKEILEKLRELPIWESFVEGYDDMDTKEVGNWYEENILSQDLKLHKTVGGIGSLIRLFKKFTNEQLKGGVILNE